MRQRKFMEVSRDSWQGLRFMLSSGSGPGGDYTGCTLTLCLAKTYVSIRLPQIIRPAREKVVAQSWDAATVARMGRNWYWDYHRRELGFYVCNNHFVVKFGKQTDSWPGDRSWSCFLPWAEWQQIEHRIYGRGGELWWTETRADVARARAAGGGWFDTYFAAKKAAPAVTFLFVDYDGEVIEARTFIEERTQRIGKGWFRWVHWFRRDRVYRSLDIEFSRQVGPEKGSWKGGTLGHGLEITDIDESHEEAFRRYCDEHGLAFYMRIEQ